MDGGDRGLQCSQFGCFRVVRANYQSSVNSARAIRYALARYRYTGIIRRGGAQYIVGNYWPGEAYMRAASIVLGRNIVIHPHRQSIELAK